MLDINWKHTHVENLHILLLALFMYVNDTLWHV